MRLTARISYVPGEVGNCKALDAPGAKISAHPPGAVGNCEVLDALVIENILASVGARSKARAHFAFASHGNICPLRRYRRSGTDDFDYFPSFSSRALPVNGSL